MHLRHSIIADSVAEGPNGKKHVMGIFSAIFAPVYPCTHSPVAIFLRLEGAASGKNTCRFELNFVDADHNDVIPPLKGNIKFNPPEDGLVAADVTINIDQLPLPKPGKYEFVVRVDGRYIGALPLSAVQAQQVV